MSMFANKFKGKTVLVTGHTGFKGSWLTLWLSELGAKVIGVSNDIPTKDSNYEISNIKDCCIDYRGDICDYGFVEEVINKHKPDYIFHLAAQALVYDSYENPIRTITSNALGSSVVLDTAIKSRLPISIIMITSDKVYRNNEWIWGYRENDVLGGYDPYSASKAMAEISIQSFINSFIKKESLIKVAIARAGNVIGGGDWAANRIIPDCVRSWSKKESVVIRSPSATRPWQHVLEPLSGYLTLACQIDRDEVTYEAFNFGPGITDDLPVMDVVKMFSDSWEGYSEFYIEKNSNDRPEAGLLKLNCDKSSSILKWQGVLHSSQAIKMTADWYNTYCNKTNQDMKVFSINQINSYMKIRESF